jgi:hypothetical protein
MSTLRTACVLGLASQVSGLALYKYEGDTAGNCAPSDLVVHDYSDLGFTNDATATTCLAIQVSGTDHSYKFTCGTDDSTPATVEIYTADGVCGGSVAASGDANFDEITAYIKENLKVETSADFPTAACYTNGADSWKVSCSGATGVPNTYHTIKTYMEADDTCASDKEMSYLDSWSDSNTNHAATLGLVNDAGESIISAGTDAAANPGCFKFADNQYYKVTTCTTGNPIAITAYTDETCSTEESSGTTIKDAVEDAFKAIGGQSSLPNADTCYVDSTSDTTFYRIKCDDSNANLLAGLGHTLSTTAAADTTSGSVAATVSALAVTAGLWML